MLPKDPVRLIVCMAIYLPMGVIILMLFPPTALAVIVQIIMEGYPTTFQPEPACVGSLVIRNEHLQPTTPGIYTVSICSCISSLPWFNSPLNINFSFPFLT